MRLTTSTRAEIVVLGNSVPAVLALAGRWLAAPGDTDYEVISGEVSREGSSSVGTAGSTSIPRPTATASPSATPSWRS